MPVYKLWNLDTANNPLTSFTIGLDTTEVMVAKIKEEQWPIYKIKLTSSEAIQTVAELRKHTDAILRVDANCAWTADETIEYS